MPEESEPGAQAPSVGQRDGPDCSLTHCVAAKADELLVEGQLSEDLSEPGVTTAGLLPPVTPQQRGHGA